MELFLACTLSNSSFFPQLEMEWPPMIEVIQRLGELGDLISRNKNVLVRSVLRYWLLRVLMGSLVSRTASGVLFCTFGKSADSITWSSRLEIIRDPQVPISN